MFTGAGSGDGFATTPCETVATKALVALPFTDSAMVQLDVVEQAMADPVAPE